MKLAIDRSALAELITRGGSSAQRNGVVPILSHVRLVAEDGGLTATSTDLTMQAEAFATAAIETPGAACVAADALKMFVDRLPAKATAKIEQDGNFVTVSAGRLRARLPALPVADFASLDVMKGGANARFTLTAAEMAAVFTRPLPAASNETTRFYLCGVYLHVTGDRADRLSGCATNGHILLVSSIALPDGAAELPPGNGRFAGVIVPTETVNAALRLFGREDSVEVEVGRGGIVFHGGTTTLASKVIEGSFPDYVRLIPEPAANRINLDRASTTSAVNAIEIFNNGRESGHSVDCAPVENGLAMLSGESDGEGHAVADAEIEGDVPQFGVSSRYLKTVLGAFGSETVTLYMIDAGSPIRVEGANDPAILGIIMPMRSRRNAALGVAA